MRKITVLLGLIAVLLIALVVMGGVFISRIPTPDNNLSFPAGVPTDFYLTNIPLQTKLAGIHFTEGTATASR